MNKFRLAWYCAIAISGVNAVAQQPRPNLGDVSLEELGQIQVFSASQHSQDVRDAPSSVTVITAMVGFVTLEFAGHGADERDAWEGRLRTRFEELDPSAFPVLTSNVKRLSNQAFIVRWKGGTNSSLKQSHERYIDVVLDGLQRQLPGPGGS